MESCGVCLTWLDCNILFLLINIIYIILTEHYFTQTILTKSRVKCFRIYSNERFSCRFHFLLQAFFVLLVSFFYSVILFFFV